MLLSISWKNIWRNPLRSLLVLFAIAIGLFSGLFCASLMKGMVDQRLRMAISTEVSNLQIHNEHFILNKELSDTIMDTQTIEGMLDTMKEVTHYSARLKVVGMAASAVTGSGVMINGILPSSEKLVSDVYQYIPDSSGTWFEKNKSNLIVIGRKLADKLKIKLHSKIVLTFQDKDGNIASGAFKVEGIYKSLNTSFDEANVYVKDQDLRNLLGIDHGQMHEIAVCLADDRTNDAVTGRLKSMFPGLSILGWKEIMPDLGMMSDFTNMSLYIIMIIILLALSFGIINTMMMAVLERTREIGMLMALGMNRKRVFLMIMLESLFLSLTGGIIGMVAGAIFIGVFSSHGLDLSQVAKGLEDLGYSAILYPSMDLSFCAGLTILVIITGILSSIMPARRALKLKPAEAIRTL